MRAVGVRELKTHLSRYLREVERGEVLLVTDHARVIAELRPAGNQKVALSGSDRVVLEWAEQGLVRLPTASDESQVLPASPLSSPAGLSAALLEEERGEE